jgi:hypothetical protein
MPVVTDRTATSITASGLASFSDFAVGDLPPGLAPPDTAARDTVAGPAAGDPPIIWFALVVVGLAGALLAVAGKPRRPNPPRSSRWEG